MKISAIIPAYNAEKYLVRAVDSLIATQYPNLEIVVIDDGSSDGTWSVAEALVSRHPGKIRLLSHPGHINRGVSATRNLGIRESTGELICFLDADDYVYPYRFDVAAKILSDRLDVDAVYELCKIEFENEEVKKNRLWGESLDFGIAVSLNGTKLLEKLLEGQSWATSAILVRKAFLDQVGLFPEGVCFAEDCDLWIRMACSGRVVSGSLENPVSVYWRHDQNTYHYMIERRLDLLRAIVNSYIWCRSIDIDNDMRITLRSGLQRYLLRSLIVARESGQDKIVKNLAKIATKAGYSIFCHNLLLRQFISIYKEKLFKPIH